MTKLLPLLLSLLIAPLALAQDAAQFDVGGFRFTRPAEWKSVPVTSPMRKAQLAVPAADAGGTAAEVTFFTFGGNAGGVDANVQRWIRQFDAPAGTEKVEKKEISGTKVTLVTTEGTFQSGMPGGPTTPMTNYALHGAILDAGQDLVFIKMTGPAAVVKGAGKQFAEMIEKAAGSKAK